MISCKLFYLFGLACAIIFALIDTASSIECYDCNSNTDKNCSLKVPPDYLRKNCSPNVDNIRYTMCRKITQTIDFEVNGLKPDSRVIRSCAYEPHIDNSKDCYQRSGFGGRQEVCTCHTNLCNSSNNIKINYILMAVAPVMYVFSVLYL